MKLFQTSVKIQNYMKKKDIKEKSLLKSNTLAVYKTFCECSGMCEEIPGSST